MTKNELLSGVPFFSSLGADAVTELASQMRLRKVRRGDRIFSQGDPGDSLFLVASGRIKIFIEDAEGEQLTILFCGPGNCFGEMALLDGKARSATAEALEQTEVWVVTRRSFLDLVRNSPEISIEVIVFLCSKLRTNLARMEEFIFLDTYDRVGRQLLRIATRDDSGTYTVKITQEELARVVGNSREQVNRVLADLASLGHVSVSRGQISLTRFDALRQMFPEGDGH
jgi:CRP-like cAMP-binding protein